MKNLVLKNQNNQVVRLFNCHVDKLYLLYRKKEGRFDISSLTPLSEKEKKQIKILKEIRMDEFQKDKYPVFADYYLEVVDEVSQISPSPKVPQEDLKDFWLSLKSVMSVFLVFIIGALIFYGGEPTIEEEQQIEPQVVKIIKPPRIITPEKVVLNSRSNFSRKSKVRTRKKPVKKSLKRMGALAALGSLSKNSSKQQGGLNLGANSVSSGPGLRSIASSKGSGGVQASVYGKGMVTQALGSGGNIKGGGGYGTKGRASGGGKAGYGKVSLVGSGGGENLSESSTINLEGGGFDFSLVERRILQESGKIHNCYDRALKFDSNLKGIFVTQFFINQRGRVVSSKVHKTSEVKSKEISDCILSIIDQIKFDNVFGQKGLLNIVFPFDLASLGS
ncbi:MAG: AgmX/PglI C-terminal domain-containing protein [Bdellovibrionales bacterium]